MGLVSAPMSPSGRTGPVAARPTVGAMEIGRQVIGRRPRHRSTSEDGTAISAYPPIHTITGDRS